MAAPRLGVLLATAPEEGDFPLVQGVVEAALSAGRDVGLFLMDDGVRYALDPRLAPLLRAGVEVTACATDAEARGLPAGVIESAGVLLGSQHDHAPLVRDSDRFLSFT